jgi:ATP-dependent exoDNAse (exonuclease V) beta subunit
MLREDRAETEAYDLPGSGAGDEARSLGNVLHRVIEAAGRGRRGENLGAFTRAAAAEEGLSHAVAERLVGQLGELLRIPAIAAMLEPGDAAFELPLMRVTDGTTARRVMEGVMDAARLREGRWQVVDWKLGGGGVESRSDYQRQVDTYAAMLAALSGEPAEGRIVAVPPP